MNLTKITSWVLYVLMAVSIVVAVLFYADGTSEADSGTNQYVDLTLYWGYILVVVALAATVLLSIFNFVKNVVADPKSALGAIVPILGTVAVVGISYALADGSQLYMPNYDGTGNSFGWLKFADTLFFTMYFLFGVAIVSVLASSVIKIFR